MSGLSGVVTRDLRHSHTHSTEFKRTSVCRFRCLSPPHSGGPGTLLILTRFAAVSACSRTHRTSRWRRRYKPLLLATPMALVLSEQSCIFTCCPQAVKKA